MAEPIEEQHHAMMNALAAGVDDILNGEDTPPEERKLGFTLLVAEFGKMDGGRVNYISNGNREDMLTMLREFLARVEGRYAEPATKVAQ